MDAYFVASALGQSTLSYWIHLIAIRLLMLFVSLLHVEGNLVKSFQITEQILLLEARSCQRTMGPTLWYGTSTHPVLLILAGFGSVSSAL
jgi:hypothetical protein